MSLDAFCENSRWDDGDFADLSLLNSTPCFEECILLFPVYFAMLTLSSWRISFVRREAARADPQTKPLAGWAFWAPVVLLVVSTLVPLLQLNVLLSAGNYAIYEIVSLSIGTLSWLLVTTAFVQEAYHPHRRGFWVLRFLYAFSLVAQAVKLQTLQLLSQQEGREYSFYASCVGVGAVALLTAIAYFQPLPPVFDGSYQALETVPDDEEPLDCSSPEADASLWSKITFSWLSPLVALGYKRPLEQEDLFPLGRDDQSKHISDTFAVAWAKEQSEHPTAPSVRRALWRAFGWKFMLLAIPKLFNDGAQFVGPIFLEQLVKYTEEGSTMPEWRGYVYAIAIFAGLLIGALAENYYFDAVQRTGLRVRASLSVAIYDHALQMSNAARQSRSVGRTVNLMTSDSTQIQLLVGNLHLLWSSPLRIVVSLVLLYQLLGPASLIGLALLFLLFPLQTRTVRAMARFRKAGITETDARIKLVTELLGGMRVVKTYSWGGPMMTYLSGIRERELSWLKKTSFARAANMFLISTNPVLLSVGSFGAFVLLEGGSSLDASIAFTALSLFNTLRFPLLLLPQVISSLVEGQVALNRLDDFLASDRIVPPPRMGLPSGPRGPRLAITNGNFSWDSKVPTLSDINIDIPAGKLVGVIGPTGSGKTSLISALLGEMTSMGGALEIEGRVAYAPQQAWIFNATLKENIIFGRPYDAERYARAIETAQLTRDLTLMGAGDQTEIGEKGINLSGGQRQRLNIARAVYAETDIVLLDDPLSALDAKVGRAVFDKCICGELAGRTRVVATNQLAFLPKMDIVVVMSHGHIAEMGSYAELMQARGALYRLISEQGLEGADEVADDADADDADADAGADAKPAAEPAEVPLGSGSVNVADGDSKAVVSAEALAKKAKLTVKEERETGSVSWDVYKTYFAAAGGRTTMLYLLLAYVIVEGTRLGSSSWLTVWSSDDLGESQGFYLGIYALLSFAQVFSQGGNSILVATSSIVASRTLHRELLQSIFRAPMAFFDSNPLGRILNRMSSDMNRVDLQLAATLDILFRGIIQLLGTIAIIGFSSPYALVAVVPLGALFAMLQRYFLATSRELKRLDALSKSPLYAHFSESLSGLSTVRAYGAGPQMCKLNQQRLDENQRAALAGFTANRWLSVRLEFLGAVLILVTALFAVVARRTLSPELTGLALSYALTITATMTMVIRLWTEVEGNLNACERVSSYINVAPEAPEESEDRFKPDPEWPTEGAITFGDVRMRYRPDLDLVLRGLQVEIKAGEKIGICGRTGAGKSSLLQAVLRLVEAEDGQIVIDGRNIAEIGLNDLRSRIAVLPQEPLVFSTTLRHNLDPFGVYSDAELWEALKRAHLYDVVAAFPEGLDSPVAENGENYSVGQRQLVCLARACLKHSKILLLDEATANVDVETDNLIQATIRREFATCTTLTIAHRLNTIIDSDRILVLDAGRVAEYDTPAALLRNQDSIFASLVRDTGPSNEALLRSIAFGEAKLELDQPVPPQIQRQASSADFLFRGPLQAGVANAAQLIESAFGFRQNAAWLDELRATQVSEAVWAQQLVRIGKSIGARAIKAEEDERLLANSESDGVANDSMFKALY